MVDRRCVSTREISPVTMVMATKLCSVCNRKYRVCRVCYSCTIWLLNGYGYCTIRGLLKYFRGRSPRMVQAIPIKKPWYSCLVSATLIVRLLLINGLHCCLATSWRQLYRIIGVTRCTWDLYPVGASFNFPLSMIQIILYQ